MPASVSRVSAAGNSPWVSADYRVSTVQVSLAVIPAAGATVNYTVQHSYDNATQLSVALSRTTTVLTVTDANGHGLSVGDSVQLINSGMTDGFFDVATVTSATVFTLTVPNTGAAAGTLQTRAVYYRVFPHAFLVAGTARADGNYAFPVQFARLKVNSISGGAVDFIVTSGGII